MNSVERVKSLCKERKIPISRLEKELGFANGYINQLRKGVFPSDRLKQISEYFGVSVDCLLGSSTSEAEHEQNEHMATLNTLYYNGVESWIHNGFFTTEEQTTLKMHFSELLLRYKQLIEGTSGIKWELKTYLKAIEPFNKKRDCPLSVQELADQFLKQELNKTIGSLHGWIDAFTLHFSRMVAAEVLAGKIPVSAEGKESERGEVEEYRSRLLSEQSQPEQEKKPIPVSEDGPKNADEESFMRDVRAMSPVQQEQFFAQYDPMHTMREQQKDASTVSVPPAADDKAPEFELPDQS